MAEDGGAFAAEVRGGAGGGGREGDGAWAGFGGGGGVVGGRGLRAVAEASLGP